MIKRIGLGAITLGLALSLGAATAQAQAPTDKGHHATVQKRWRTEVTIAPICLIERRHQVSGQWTKWHIVNTFPGRCTS